MKRKIVFIVNPISGTKSKEKVLSYATSHPAFANDEVLVYNTRCAGDAITAARRFADEGYELIVAVGGDGTVNEVAQGVMHTNACLGIIPMGSGNGLARDLGIPMNKKKAVDTLSVAAKRTIDACSVNGQPFFCTSGMGYDALVGNLFAQSKSRGLSTYVKVAFTNFWTYKPQCYKLAVDDGELTKDAFLITVANAGQWGNNAYIAPLADMSDGLFDVVVVHPFPLWAIPSMMLKMFRRKAHKSRYITTIKSSRVVVERQQEDYIHFDGEPGRMGTMLEFTITPSALNVLSRK